MDLEFPASPLTELTLDELRTRRSAKWRAYPSDVLPMWVAEMDTPLAPPIRQALLSAVDAGDTGYVHPGHLAEAFAGFASARFGWSVDPSRCRLAPDVMGGIAAVLALVTAPGDGVLINPPVYPPFAACIEEAGRRVVESPLVPDTTGRWTLDLDRLDRDLAGPDVTAYLLCSPHNPTGTVYTADELRAVAELADRHGVRMLVDEIHAPLTYPGVELTPFLALADECPAAAAGWSFVSASKAWNLAGLKSALIVAGPRAAGELGGLSPHLRFGAGLFGVIASELAFGGCVPWLDSLIRGLDANRTLLAHLLKEALPDVGYRPPDATYLAWLDCRSLRLAARPTANPALGERSVFGERPVLGERSAAGERSAGDSTLDPAAVFLERARVAVNSGSTFGHGGEGYVRLNFATSPEVLAAGIHRMAEAVRRAE